MKRVLSATFRRAGVASLVLAAGHSLLVTPAARAQQAPPAPAPSAGLSAASPAPAAALAPASSPASPLSAPSMAASLSANPTPTKFDAGPLGPVYVTGVASGLAEFTGNPTSTDRSEQFDVSNGQVVIQNTSGLVQFYAQLGIYSLPSLGTPYIHADTTNSDFFGPLLEGYIKIVPNGTVSIEAGKLPSLIGDETTFTFQNMNIERGLLWNQEPAISRGVQGNLTLGPVAASLSLNDGFYSSDYNWISGSLAYTIDGSNTLSVVGGGNFGTSGTSTLATPLPQNNSQIVNLIYTYSAAPWTINPYFQFTNVPSNARLGFTSGASTYGGALLVDYAVNPVFNVAGRAEYISSSGSTSDGAPNLLYGPGSSAFSLTLTPTYQRGIFFARVEASVVEASDITAGLAFGHGGNARTQARFVMETGVLF